MAAILHPVGPGVQIPIDRAVVLIGRSPDCDVVLNISSRISRMHCALIQVDTSYFIRDLGSMNGVQVAGQRVEKDVKLTNGVEVIIGDLKFLFMENVAMPVRAARPPTSGKGSPVLIDDSVEMPVVKDVEIVKPASPARPPANAPPRPFVYPSSARSPGSSPDRMQRLNPDIIEDAEVVDAEIVEDVELVDDFVDAIEVVENVDVIEDIDIIEDVEVIEEVDVIEDVEVIEEVEFIDDKPRRRRPPELR